MCCEGGLAGKESDVAADEAAALSNIHGLLDSLESQRQSMLARLDATEVHSQTRATTKSFLVCNILCGLHVPGRLMSEKCDTW